MEDTGKEKVRDIAIGAYGRIEDAGKREGQRRMGEGVHGADQGQWRKMWRRDKRKEWSDE